MIRVSRIQDIVILGIDICADILVGDHEVLLGLLLFPVVFKFVLRIWECSSSSANSESRTYEIGKSLIFFASLGFILIVIIPSWMQFAQDFSVHPFLWVTLSVAKMVAQEFTVDLNKPLVYQVGYLGESYQEWVHQPIVSKEGPRFFESDFGRYNLFFLTRTVWWAIPVIWLRVVCWAIYKSIQMGVSLPHIAFLVVYGIFLWTLNEYSLHRFLFHIDTKSYWGNTIHYLLHGCHHKHPMDGLRLVFPPAATAILLFPGSGIGGHPKVQDTFASISGYCEQTDIHSPQITIEESVVYSARLRLSSQIDPYIKAAWYLFFCIIKSFVSELFI
ncbi:hypothetical protein SO802_016124 [Lithocarpus litseifolius]|uniref:Fatty acid hydroxylase domain-containing protein n=1 Tax=Lithocarpus litseifolius TaxID=425828 RepID=A0AAW2CVL0_9ROSI